MQGDILGEVAPPPTGFFERIEVYELFALMLGLALLAFILFQLRDFRAVRNWRLLLGGAVVHVAARFFTVAEDFGWRAGFNTLEHLCYLGSVAFVLAWCWAEAGTKRPEER